MKHNNTSSSSGGIGILGVLQIIFIVLKLLNLITWPWKVVLIPFWIELGLLVIVLLFILGCEIRDARKYK